MHPLIHDHLIREARALEWDVEDGHTLLAAAYDELAQSCARGDLLRTVLAGRADDEANATRPQARRDRETRPEEAFAYVREVGPIEALHEFATALDALIAVQTLTRPETTDFLQLRAALARRPALNEDVLVEARERGYELGAGQPNEEAIYDNVGRTRDTWIGPSERQGGVRVLAVELCADGTVIHVHFARRARSANGVVGPLPDDVDVDAPGWPAVAALRLADDLGTVYRGRVALDDFADANQEQAGEAVDIVGDCRFVPAVPQDAERLWLQDNSGETKIVLR